MKGLGKIKFKSNVRWQVVFKDPDNWAMGLYRPENRSLKDVKYLEKHDGPELFVLLEGEVVLVLSEDGSKIEEVEMEKGIGYIVNCWHNAYSPKGDGLVLVIERDNIKTEFIDNLAL